MRLDDMGSPQLSRQLPSPREFSGTELRFGLLEKGSGLPKSVEHGIEQTFHDEKGSERRNGPEETPLRPASIEEEKQIRVEFTKTFLAFSSAITF